MPPTTSPGSFKNIPPPEEWIRLEPYYHHLLSFPSVNSVGNSGKPWRFQPTRWSHRCQAFNLLVKELLPFSQAKRSELKSPEVFRGFPVVARASAWLLGLGGWKWVGWKKTHGFSKHLVVVDQKLEFIWIYMVESRGTFGVLFEDAMLEPRTIYERF